MKPIFEDKIMSKRKNTDLQIEVVSKISREEVLNILSDNILKLNKKIQRGQIRDNEKEKIRIQQFKAIVYGCNTFNNILRDEQMDMVLEELESIKSSINKSTAEEIAEDMKVVEETIRKLNDNEGGN